MIRLLFALFITLSGFVAAALWMLNGGDAQKLVEEILPAEVRTFDLEDVTSLLPEALPRAAAVAPEIDTGGSSAEPEEEPVEVLDLPARSEFLAGAGAGANESAEETDANASEGTSTAVAAVIPIGDAVQTGDLDQDEWALLIRRMLSVYRRTGALE